MRMRVEATAGREDIAQVYLAEMRPGKYVEFVHSLQPPFPRDEKWVLIVSTLFGCPVGCRICDAGGWYEGKLTATEILDQIDYLVNLYFPDRVIPVSKFKIQFARMGEPALNPAVLEVLEELPRRFHAPGLMPSISTVAPAGCESVLDPLIDIKNKYYADGNFQMQFSVHTTDPEARDRFIPVKKWDFETMARYGERFYRDGERKITLNFALAQDSALSARELKRYFDPGIFMVKLTPVNPTVKVIANGVINAVRSDEQAEELPEVKALRDAGYDVIVSIGELEENKIGSNCGQYVKTFLEGNRIVGGETYQYQLNSL